MRCSEVKRRLSERSAVGDSDVRDHLLSCSSCAREAEAAGVIARILASNRGEEPVPSLASVRKRVESRLANQTVLEKIVDNIKDTYNARPKLAIGFAATLAVLLFVTLVPFSYTRTTGFQATISVAADAEQFSPKLAEGALVAMGYEEATVELRDGEAWTVSNLPSEKEAYILGRTIAQLSGSESEAQVAPVTENKRTPLLAQLVERLQKTDNEEPKSVNIEFHDGRLILSAEMGQGWNSSHTSDSVVLHSLKKSIMNLSSAQDEIDVEVETNSDSTMRLIRLWFGESEDPADNEHAISVLVMTAPDHVVEDALDLSSFVDSSEGEFEVHLNNWDFPGRHTIQIHIMLDDDES